MTGRSPEPMGFAIDEYSVAAVWREGGAWRSESATHSGTPDSIVDTIAALAERAPASQNARVTLSRPLAHLRIVELPRMARAMAEQVLARDASRHVVAAHGKSFQVSAREITRNQWCAAFAPADLLEAISRFADEHGWRFEILAADDALTGALDAGVRSRVGTSACVVVCGDRAVTDAVCIRNGVPVLGRHFFAGASDEDMLAFIEWAGEAGVAAGTEIRIIGDRSRAALLANVLGTRGHLAQHIELGLSNAASPLSILAAAGTRSPGRFALAAARMQARNARAMHWLAGQFAAGTAVALILAFSLEHWQTARALTAARQERADISAAVRAALAERAGIEEASDAIRVLAQHESQSSRASAAAAAIAIGLPRAAALSALTIAADTVLLDGTSLRSAEVYEALRRLPILEQVRLAAPFRQELLAPDTAIERFSFSARIRAPAGVRP